MEFNKEFIGGLVINCGEARLVTGYDFIKRQYITEKISNKKYWSHSTVRECDIIKNPETATKRKEDNDKKISDISKLINVDDNIRERLSDNELSEYTNLYNRLENINDNIKSINQLLQYRMSEEDKKFFIRELTKTRKGLRRRLKRLYRYATKIEYQFIYNTLNDYGIHSISYYKYKLNDLQNENKLIDVYLTKYDEIKYLLEEPRKIEVPYIKYVMNDISKVIKDAMVD